MFHSAISRVKGSFDHPSSIILELFAESSTSPLKSPFNLKPFIHDLRIIFQPPYVLHQAFCPQNQPQFLGPNIHNLIQDYLHKKVEGTCNASGYIVTVLRIDRISEGKILLTGQASFKVYYQAIVLRPEKGEVVDAPIVSSTKMGFFACIGPLSIFISNYQIPGNLIQGLGNDIVVRLKIIGTKIDNTKVYAIGTLNDDCLGIIS